MAKFTMRKAIEVIREEQNKGRTLKDIIVTLKRQGFPNEIILKSITRDLLEID